MTAREHHRSVSYCAAILLGTLLAACSKRQADNELRAAGASETVPSASAAVIGAAAPSASAACASPESLDTVPLSSARGTSELERAALAAARAELVRLLDRPSEYRASVVTAGDLVLLELWHESHFRDADCVTLGNPSGKSRTLTYDASGRKIVATKFWQ